MAGRVQSILGRLLLPALLAGSRLEAAPFDLGITTEPAVATISRDLKYALSLTNASGGLLTNVVVSSTFSAPIGLVSATNFAGTVALEGSAIVFRVPQLTNAGRAAMELVVEPQSPGLLTNFFQIFADGMTNQFTNIVRQVFAAEADLRLLSLQSETNALVTGDVTQYRFVLTNAGPDTVPQVLITNRLPAGAQWLALTPSNSPVTVAGTQAVFSAGALAVSNALTFDVVLQVNTAGTNQLSVQVAGADLSDPAPNNNAVTNLLRVVPPLTGNLTAAIVSTQRFNPQTGLMEQTIRLANTGAVAVAGSRVVFTGLTNRLFNAAGTNAGRPFVTLTRALAAGENEDLLIEYFAPARVPFPDPVIEALEVPPFVPAAPRGDTVALTRALRRDNGALLLEFAAEPGRAYHVIYSAEATFTNAWRALPAITAPADRVQWIDEGPPKTSRRLNQVTTRFYRIIEAE